MVHLAVQVHLWEQTSTVVERAALARGPVGPGGAAPSTDDKVEYEGMLISAAAAEGRRCFLASYHFELQCFL